jgi:hypothetical protein
MDRIVAQWRRERPDVNVSALALRSRNASRADVSLGHRICTLSRQQHRERLTDERRLRDATPTRSPFERRRLILGKLHDGPHHLSTRRYRRAGSDDACSTRSSDGTLIPIGRCFPQRSCA